jgi:FAD/FMN-containing dehydrogenase
MLNSVYGMAADQVLEWEVVTPEGKHVVANPETNADLYWALSGGGGGTYGIVLSSTVRLHPDGPIAGGSLSFANTNNAVYWQAVAQWLKRSPEFVGENNTIIFLILKDAFQAVAITLPDQPESAVPTLLADYTNDLKRLNISYSLKTTYSNTYLDHFQGTFGPLPYGPNNPTTILMNRIVPRKVIESNETTSQLIAAFKDTVATGEFLIGCLLMNASTANHPENAVLPAWREAAFGCNVNAYWNYTAPLSTNIAMKHKLAHVHMPAIEAASPGGGVYLNEMDPLYQGDWKQSLFGANHDKLLEIKHKYDPEHLLWGGFTIGSDERVLQGDGRLCKIRGAS